MEDELASFRDCFEQVGTYLCGNSLGLQPKAMRQTVLDDLDRWAKLGVEGHFVEAGPSVPWVSIEDISRASAANIVGALETEVVCMNSLTVNLHLLMAAFYKPTPERYKILIEAQAFPSDEYAVQSCATHHNLDPATTIVRLEGSSDDIVRGILAEDNVAVVLIAGVQYYTGEFFNIKKITEAAHAVGAVAGFDLAHAVGNVPLSLHDDQVDFACWCSYKYLNAGPGALAGAYVHDKHEVQGLRGWWGNERKTRFDMEMNMRPQRGVAGLQLSNPPTIPMLQLKDAYNLIVEASMPKLRAKSIRLTQYLEDLLRKELNDDFNMLTPTDPERRGAQLSLVFEPPKFDVEKMAQELRSKDIFVDVRKPNVIRVAPAPIYNSFDDVLRFVTVLGDIVRT